MPTNDRRDTTRTDNLLTITVVAPIAILCIGVGVAVVVMGLWFPGLGALVVGCVLAMSVVRQAQRSSRVAKRHSGGYPSPARTNPQQSQWPRSPLTRVVLLVAALTAGAFIAASIVGTLPRAVGVAAALMAVAPFLLLTWLGNRHR